jgi:beta-lactam-binding protein with PASTA domain
MLRGFQFALVVLMLAVLALLSAITTMHFAIHAAEVTVPSFKDLTVAQCDAKAAALGLNLNVDNHLYSADIPVGRIVSQFPAPGTVVRRDWHVRVMQSLGPQRVAIPDLGGLDQRVASIQIRRASLDLGAVAEIPWSYATPGTVIAQNPAPGAANVSRPSVSLLVAASPASNPDARVMSDLTGQMYTFAAQAVTAAGLKLAPEVAAPAAISGTGSPGAAQPSLPVVAAGRIVAQSPSAGSRVDASTPIQLTVSQ